MQYKLQIRDTKRFELYNDLEAGDRVELGIFLKEGEGPRKGGKRLEIEQL